MSKEKQIEKKECKKCLHYEMCLDNFRKAKEEGLYELTSEEEYFTYADECDFCAVGYRKQSEGENYKELYEQLLEDFKSALYYAGKNNNVCNFCEHDLGEGGTCKGREDWINCNPKWRGIVKGGAE